MNDTKRGYAAWAIAVVAATLLATAYAYAHLPDQVPAHWNLAGAIDRYGPRGWLFTMPVIQACLALLWLVLPGVSPEQFSVERFSTTWWFCGKVMLALLACIQAELLWGTWTGSMQMGRAYLGAICVVMLLLGNVMGKVKRNFWLGVRTPWTLADERVWYATHRLAGKTMVAGGVLGLGAVLAGLPAPYALAAVLLGACVPAVYSLFVFRRLRQA